MKGHSDAMAVAAIVSTIEVINRIKVSLAVAGCIKVEIDLDKLVVEEGI